MLKLKQFLLILSCVMILAACQPKTTKPNNFNLVPLNQMRSYQMLGKMSFSDGQDGGSGRIDWQNNQGLVKAVLKAPLGAKSWQIQEMSDGAKIIDAEGGVYFAESAGALISGQLGWEVPWDQLKSWHTGEVFNATDSELRLTQDGFEIEEGDWLIKFSKIKSYPDGELPMKIIARKDNYSIKIAVRSWNW